jgi:hypothetical protein
LPRKAPPARRKASPRINSTAAGDISAEENPWSRDETISIKTAQKRNDYIPFASALRPWDYDSGERRTLLLAQYVQRGKGKHITDVWEIRIERAALFGDVTREEIAALENFVRAIAKNHRPAKEERAKYLEMAAALNARDALSYRPKVDSHSQRRLQCELCGLSGFLDKRPELVISHSTERRFRDIVLPASGNFPPRQRRASKK